MQRKQIQQTALVASLTVWMVCLILLALTPQPAEMERLEDVLQVAISPELRPAVGVPSVHLAATTSATSAPSVTKSGKPLPAMALPKSDVATAKEAITGLADENGHHAAAHTLLRLGHGTIPLLHNAQKTATPEVRERIAAVLSKFSREISGRGLQITLTADKQDWKQGETIVFTTRVTNTLNEPQNLYVGYSLTGVAFESAQALRVTTDNSVLGQMATCTVGGFCGTGAGPIFRVIPAGESVVFKSQMKFNSGPVPTWGGGGNGPPVRHYQAGMFAMPAPTPGLHRFRVHHKVTSVDNQVYGSWRHGKADTQARYWVGQLASNEVVIRVTN